MVTSLVEGTQIGNVIKRNFRSNCNVCNNFSRKNAFIFCITENQLKIKISECYKKGNQPIQGWKTNEKYLRQVNRFQFFTLL